MTMERGGGGVCSFCLTKASTPTKRERQGTVIPMGKKKEEHNDSHCGKKVVGKKKSFPTIPPIERTRGGKSERDGMGGEFSSTQKGKESGPTVCKVPGDAK